MLRLAFVKNVDYRRVNCHHSQKDHNKKIKEAIGIKQPPVG